MLFYESDDDSDIASPEGAQTRAAAWGDLTGPPPAFTSRAPADSKPGSSMGGAGGAGGGAAARAGAASPARGLPPMTAIGRLTTPPIIPPSLQVGGLLDIIIL